MDMLTNQVGQEGPSLGWRLTTGPAAHTPPWRCYIWRLATPPREGVRLMWKKKLLQLLRVLVIAAVVMAMLTTKAC